MKQDKALLTIDGKSLLQRQFELLTQVVSPQDIYVSGVREGFQYICDKTEGRGPVEGLRSVLEHLESNYYFDKILILPVDMPLLNQQLLNQLVDAAKNEDVIGFADHNFPLLIQNAKRVLEVIRQLQETSIVLDGNNYKNSNYSISKILKLLNVKWIEIEQPVRENLKNINTPQEWSKLNYVEK